MLTFSLLAFHLLLHVFLLSFSHLALCCPIEVFSCGSPAKKNTSPSVCGGQTIRCFNHTLQFQFGKEGLWYTAENIMYPERTLVIHDMKLGKRLQSTDCDFLYKFTPPINGIEITNIESKILFDCRPTTYDFSRDLFRQRYGYTDCMGYELYYSHEPNQLVLSDDDHENCTMPVAQTEAAVRWEFMFQEEDKGVVGFSLKSVSFSRRYNPISKCFGCRLSGGECSSVQADSSSCICHHPCPGNNSLSKAKKIGIGAGAAMFILVFLFIGILLFKYGWVAVLSSSNFDDKNVEAFLTSNRLLAVKRYKYSEVKRMTTTFREKLGQGGFGTVYKGKLEDGTLVAVKFLKGSKGSSGEEFINEVASIGRTNHVNVVRLLGFCVEGYKRVLIYEFMANGSLEKFLFVDHPTHPIASVVLDWQKLHEIAVGIARGLEYLHKGCNTRMVHFDIKPHNILLDDDLRPKISDFGLAKFCKPKESVLSTICARGTIGYIAPEVFSRNFGVVSGKSDVYSYGMMLLEMAGRRRNVRKTQDIQNTSEIYFPHWIYQHLDECYGLEACVDSAENEIARKMILVGLWCIQTNPSSRPSTNRVVEMLEGSAKDVQIPPKPYICSLVRSRCNSNADSLSTFSS